MRHVVPDRTTHGSARNGMVVGQVPTNRPNGGPFQTAFCRSRTAPGAEGEEQ